MTPFAVVISWLGHVPTRAELNRAFDPVRGRCSDGSLEVDFPGAAAVAGLRAVEPGDRVEHAIAARPEQGFSLVGDVRLYDRDSLVALLGESHAPASDLELLADAYAVLGDQLGDRLLAQLAGDFAFVVWDWGKRRALAFRDQFGLRPLHYRHVDHGIAFASDIASLLALDASDREVDPVTSLDYLLGQFTQRDHTFFRNIAQVEPGQALVVGPHRVSKQPYWRPAVESVLGTHVTYQDSLAEWRHLFRTAVRDRMRSSYPTALYLSGGLDSSSIAGVAHDLSGEVPSPTSVTTMSAQFPGLTCDETPFIDLMCRHLPSFHGYRWDATARNEDDFVAPAIAMPRLREGMGRGPRTEIAAMRERGVRVVLGGTGGDELGWSHGVFRDLLAGAHIMTLMRELRAMGSTRRALRHLRANLKGVEPKPELGSPPGWLGPATSRLFGRRLAPEQPPGPFSSHVQQQTWAMLTFAQGSAIIDVSALAWAEAGAELRLPYRDVRLANFVLRLPWAFKLPRGDMRRYQREAVAPFLPVEVNQRIEKSLAGPAVAHQIRQNLIAIRSIISGKTWISGEFVSQAGAHQVLGQLMDQDPDVVRPRPWHRLWRIAVFEAWLRKGLRLTSPPKVGTR